MRKWGMSVYLDAGSHVNLDEKPCFYCGVLNLYRLRHQLRADLNKPDQLEAAEAHFVEAHKQLLAEGGGVVSIFYHPCEFVHQTFWDGVNFSKGANPPRSQWKAPPAKTPEESRSCYRVFEDYIRFIKRFPEVRFITASQAVGLYADRARKAKLDRDDLRAIATRVADEVTFQKHKDCTLSAAEVFWLLNEYVASRSQGKEVTHLQLKSSPLGPTGRAPLLASPVTTDASQLQRTSVDVADYLEKHGQVPTACWLGSAPVPPEAYLRTLARVALQLLDGKAIPEQVEFQPATLAAARYVAEDYPGLWGWVIFPPGFRAPGLMALARQQAWTLKPALLVEQPQ
jgi:hypothetical protein